jgi:hypothetical protein
MPLIVCSLRSLYNEDIIDKLKIKLNLLSKCFVKESEDVVQQGDTHYCPQDGRTIPIKNITQPHYSRESTKPQEGDKEKETNY